MKWRDTAKRLMPVPAVRFLKYRAEHRLLTKEAAPGRYEPSVVLFSVHKCASTFLHRLLDTANRQHLGLTRIDAAGYAQLVKASAGYVGAYDFIRANAGVIFRPVGYAYGPLRRFVEIEGIEDYRVCLVLRDPRDVLVSSYYSLAYSHPLPFGSAARRSFLSRRNAARIVDIDTFVLKEAEALKETYDAYWSGLVTEHAIRPLRYEEMWYDFRAWLGRFLRQLGVEPDEATRLQVERQIGFERTPKAESVHRHRRKGTPGDHREKLREDTQARLNDVLGTVLERFGYA